MRDLMLALQSMSLATPPIFGLVEGRIYINEIPKEQVDKSDTHHPPKMLVIRLGGGGANADLMVVRDRTIICNCYGETDYEAELVAMAVEQRYTFLQREIFDDVLIHHINPTGGPLPNVEKDLVWPIISQAYTVKANVLEVA